MSSTEMFYLHLSAVKQLTKVANYLLNNFLQSGRLKITFVHLFKITSFIDMRMKKFFLVRNER